MLSHVGLFASPWTIAFQAPLSVESSGKNTGVGCRFLLQGIFQPRDQTCISCVFWIGWQILYHWATWETIAPISPLEKEKQKNETMKQMGNLHFPHTEKLPGNSHSVQERVIYIWVSIKSVMGGKPSNLGPQNLAKCRAHSSCSVKAVDFSQMHPWNHMSSLSPTSSSVKGSWESPDCRVAITTKGNYKCLK